ncbi:arabinosylfuranosidase ArfA [Arthrobacter sp. YN]|uniref:arabinosylfuranosidase ArfA n=1 Tax=Arthrobacter sp. YN TaxID=2020486 RepID=UPI000B5E3496|nr:alpha-N-arabinofuranosidase [Arthrobacter sp. YN]ASN20110.1 alpha-L-arabinofuranosidase [Arthrobacter sp. YN]
MPAAKITANPAFVVGPVRRETFGAFVEHLGRCVYTGIYEPGHRTADDAGWRGDVIELTRELGVSTVRYPGGNFVSGYRWEDGIGPKGERPVRLDLAWHTTESNQVGLDDFMDWCAKAGVEAMMAINLGTRGTQDALDVLEYCNIASGTALSDLRRKNGSEEPYGVTFWCLGNEMDGPWQIGHKTAEEYGRLAAETARAMRMIGGDKLRLVACGSSSSKMPTFGEWERTVLTETYEQVDYISAHHYFENLGILEDHLAAGAVMDQFINDIAAHIDHVKSVKKSAKDVHISFDEWNIWHGSQPRNPAPTGTDWPEAPPLLEDLYTVADAVVVGDLLITLLNNTDRVHAASLAQLVNVIAPIMTRPNGPAWKQTTFHPFALTSANAQGQVLQLAVESPSFTSPQHGEVPSLSAVATHDPETGQLTIFATNRNTTERLRISLDLTALGSLEIDQALTYSHHDPLWFATEQDSSTVLPQPLQNISHHDGHLVAELDPISWSMITLG